MLEILPEDPVKAGEVVANRYRLDRVVGEGGMGVVWAATHILTEKPCALKFLKAHRASDPRSHSRLLNEARATCRVRHPNVAPVHDILELPNGVPFIVMDLLDGEPLSALLRRVGSLDWPTTLAILVPTTEAIMAAHEQGVVHRDLKPDNVFLESASQGGYEVKVLDFGIAKRFDLPPIAPMTDDLMPPVVIPTHGLTTTNSAVGTPSYMAPEQIRHEADVGVPADIWMLGMLAYECLTGRRPERDLVTHGVALKTAEAHLAEQAKGASTQAVTLVMSMLRLDPADRPLLATLRAQMRELQKRNPAPSKRSGLWLGSLAIVAAAACVVLVGRGDAAPETSVGAVPDNRPIPTAPVTSALVAPATTTFTAPDPIATTPPAPSSAIAKTPKKQASPAPVASANATPSAMPSSSVLIPSYERK